jgi:hypothetical protein
MSHELSDLRKTNNRCARKRQRMADYRQRTRKRRDKRRELELLTMMIGAGVLRR